jgi:SAM-dependent methyltransferase
MTKANAAPIYDHADLYDAVYRGRGKDYAADTARIVTQIRASSPGASSLLDVACGTGAHLRHFAPAFHHVEGVDLSADMLRVAKKHLGDVPLHQGDMCGFDLGRRFDAVTCLFSSIGYLNDAAELDAAVGCFARHLNPGGVIVLEPWCFPEKFVPGQVMSDLVTVDGMTISRVSHATLDAGATRIEAHYVVADPDSGVRHFVDVHRLALFTRGQYERAFRLAGCTVRYLPAERGVGLFVGTRGGE